jgi:hypothetical protein
MILDIKDREWPGRVLDGLKRHIIILLVRVVLCGQIRKMRSAGLLKNNDIHVCVCVYDFEVFNNYNNNYYINI